MPGLWEAVEVVRSYRLLDPGVCAGVQGLWLWEEREDGALDSV